MIIARLNANHIMLIIFEYLNNVMKQICKSFGLFIYVISESYFAIVIISTINIIIVVIYKL